MTLATKITFTRILLIIPTAILFIVAYYFECCKTELLIVTAVLYAILCSTDIVDGMVARRTNTVSELGKFLDPLADKIVAVVMMFMLSWQSSSLAIKVLPFTSVLFVVESAIIVSRELVVGIFRAIASQKGIVIAADNMGKLKTNFTNISLIVLIIAPVHLLFSYIGQIGFFISTILTIYSGGRYLYRNKSVLEEKE